MSTVFHPSGRPVLRSPAPARRYGADVGFYRRHVVPRLVELACATPEIDAWRTLACEGMAGRVVEIGFGSGLNVGRYPDDVETVLAIEPSAVARRRSARRVAASTARVAFAGTDASALELEGTSCDAALSTFTLCTVADPVRALAELHRVLRPGGRVHFLEHGIAPEPAVAAWQHRLDPLQRRLADGCHLTRDPVALVREAGFDLERVEQSYAKGPRPWSYLSVGVAKKR